MNNLNNVSCPYPDCGSPLAAAGINSLIHCSSDECGWVVLACPTCGAGNTIWAAFCRACGREISNRNRIIDQDPLPFLEKWEESRGLFLSGMIEKSAANGWKGKLAAVDGSLLVFSGVGGDAEYSDLYLIHPHFAIRAPGKDDAKKEYKQSPILEANPIPLHPILSEGGDAKLSGASVITDRHLFLGSEDRLYQIDLASISTNQAYRPDIHRILYEIGCQEMAFLSQDLLLLIKHLEGNTARFTLWDIKKGTPAHWLEIPARFFSVAGSRLFTVADDDVMIFSVDFEKKTLKRECCLFKLRGAVPIARPIFVDGGLYLLVSRNPEGVGDSLVKWTIRGAEGIDKEPRYLHPGSYYAVSAVSCNYALLSFGGALICDSTLDRVLCRLPQEYGMCPPAGVCASGSLIALPFMNAPVSPASVAVVNGKTGQYIFTTNPFHQILSEPVLWGRFLFILGRRTAEEQAGLYGYDLRKCQKKDKED